MAQRRIAHAEIVHQDLDAAGAQLRQYGEGVLKDQAWNERKIAENAVRSTPGVTQVQDNIVLAS